jgi:hypothetical protein
MQKALSNARCNLALTAAMLALSISCQKEGTPEGKAPSRIDKIPADLANQQLDLAGIYPDGWTAPKASLTLSEPAGSHLLAIHGMIPKITADDFHCEVEVRLDDKTVNRKTVGLGDFSIESSVPPEPGNHRVELIFSPVQILPNGDGRVIGTRLSLAGFESGAPKPGTDIVERGSGLRLGDGWRAAETQQNEAFRRGGTDAEIIIDATGTATRKVVLEAEYSTKTGKPELVSVLDSAGRQVDAVEVGRRGSVAIFLPVEAGQNNRFRLHFAGAEAPDMGFRVFHIDAY